MLISLLFLFISLWLSLFGFRTWQGFCEFGISKKNKLDYILYDFDVGFGNFVWVCVNNRFWTSFWSWSFVSLLIDFNEIRGILMEILIYYSWFMGLGNIYGLRICQYVYMKYVELTCGICKRGEEKRFWQMVFFFFFEFCLVN